MLRNFTRVAMTVLLAASAALAYDGPRVTPRPTVNGSFGPIQVHQGSTSVTLAWDLSDWIAQSFTNHRPDRAFFEVKFGADFVSNTDSVRADRDARVDSGGNLFLHGARTLDIASYGRGAGDYYIRIVAKRGGNSADDDVARRSASVRVSLSAQVAQPAPTAQVRIEPFQASIVFPDGRTTFTANVVNGSGAVEWSSDLGTMVVDPANPNRATLVAPATLAQGVNRIRVTARLRSDASVTGLAQAGILRQFSGGTPQGPISNEPADKVEVLSLALNPSAPAAGEAFTASARIRNRTGRTLQVPWVIRWFGDVSNPIFGQDTATLGPNQETTVQAYCPSSHGITGGARIVVRLDREGTLGESDDARQNNYKVVSNNFQQAASGDQVQAVWISTSSETPGTNQPLTVMFVVKNLTNRELRNVEYRILMDGGNEVTFGRIASLAAGQQVEVRGTVPGSWLSTSGPRLFTGMVDPDNRLNESSTSQGNNAVDKSVNVYRTVQR